MVRNVDFGSEGAKSFTLKASGSGKLEIRFQAVSKETVATFEFSSSTTDHVFEVDPAVFQGTRNVFFVFTEASNVKFDAWHFDTEATGIQEVSTTETSSHIYDINGVRRSTPPTQGMYIKDGKKWLMHKR